MNKEGAIAGMATGLVLTGIYIVHFKIGFGSGVIGACALLGALAFAVLYFGTRDRGDGTRGSMGFAAGGVGLAVIGLLGLVGLMPSFGAGVESEWFLGISPEGFGTVGMIVSFVVSIGVALLTSAPPQDVQDLVEEIRIPSVDQPAVTGPAPAPAE